MGASVKKERDVGLDLVRVVATLLVVLGHYSLALQARGEDGYINYGLYYANGEMSLAAVAMFLVLSGAVLWRNDSRCKNWWAFFKKRWLSLFPIFYIAWLAAYFMRVCKSGNLLWGGHPAKMLLTLIGMDSYLAYRVTGYGLVGEWFFGAIVLLYLLFPVLCWCFRKHPLLTMALAVAAYIALLFWYPLQISRNRNLVVCITTFLLGFCLERWPVFRRWPAVVAAGMGFAVMFLVPLHLPGPLPYTLTGVCLLVVLRALGPIIRRYGPLCRAVTWLARYSFAVILVHHILLNELAAHIPGPFYIWRGSLFLAVTLVASLGFGVALKVCSDHLIATVRGRVHRQREEQL